MVNGFLGLLGLGAVGTEEGSARLELCAREEHLNPAGTVHGGVLATLVDTAMAHAAHDAMEGEAVVATTQLTVTYLSPGHPGPMVVTAQVRKRGKHVLVCDADVEQDDSALVHAVATFAVLNT